MHYPEHLLKLISVLKKLPGVGSKTAERYAFQMIDWHEEKLSEMGEIIRSIKQKLKQCGECGALVGELKCPYCDLTKREKGILCVVGSPKDIFSIEEIREYQGLYHVLDNLLSPLQGKSPSRATVEKLKGRIRESQVKEVILALDSTLEGDATALFIKKELEEIGIPTTRLALGLPMGSALDFIDGGTLARAFTGRRAY